MRNATIFSAILGMVLTVTHAHADCTNTPKTRLEALECRSGQVLIKGLGDAGTLQANGRSVELTCLSYFDPTLHARAYGLRLRIHVNNAFVAQALVDTDEIDPLLDALATLGTIKKQVTGLPSYEAVFVTKDDFRVSSYNIINGASETVEASIGQIGTPHLHLTLQQLSQFQTLLQQAKTILETIQKDLK